MTPEQKNTHYRLDESTGDIYDEEDDELVATATSLEMGQRICSALNHAADIEVGNMLAKKWHIDDVRGLCEEKDLGDITDDQCRETLRRVDKFHNCEVGVNWDVLQYHAECVLNEAQSPEIQPQPPH